MPEKGEAPSSNDNSSDGIMKPKEGNHGPRQKNKLWTKKKTIVGCHLGLHRPDQAFAVLFKDGNPNKVNIGRNIPPSSLLPGKLLFDTWMVDHESYRSVLAWKLGFWLDRASCLF
jgi:hypothetical protein